jgi:hypothetical protein
MKQTTQVKEMKKKTEELKVFGSFVDVLKVAVSNNPRPTEKKATKKK